MLIIIRKHSKYIRIRRIYYIKEAKDKGLTGKNKIYYVKNRVNKATKNYDIKRKGDKTLSFNGAGATTYL